MAEKYARVEATGVALGLTVIPGRGGFEVERPSAHLGVESRVRIETLYHLRIEARAPSQMGTGNMGYRDAPVALTRANRPEDIKLRRETRRDRFGKWLKINGEVQTGDPDFDREIYVDSDADAEDVQRTLASGAVRWGARRLIAMGFDWVTLSGWGNIEMEMTEPAATAEIYSVQGMTAALETAETMLAALPPRPASGRKKPGAGGTWVILSFVLAVLAFIFGSLRGEGPVFSRCHPLDNTPYEIGALAGLLLSILILVWVTRRIRGQSSAFGTRFFIALMLCPSLAMLGAVVAVGMNELADMSPATPHRTVVLNVSSDREEASYVVVQSWRPAEPSLYLLVTVQQHSGLKLGSPLLVTTRPGFFRWEWVESIGPASR